MTTVPDEHKQNLINNYITENETANDALEFCSECEIFVDKPSSKSSKVKYSERFIAVTKYKFLVFKRNFFGEGISIEREFFLLDLREVIAGGERDVMLFKFACGTVLNIRDQRISLCVKKSIESLRRATYGISSKYDVKLTGNDRSFETIEENSNIGPCGGFIYSYYAHCNYKKVQPRNEIIQYVTDLHESNNTEFNFSECPGFNKNSNIKADLYSVGQALKFNTYFTSIVMTDLQFKDSLKIVSSILKYNTTITKVVIRYTGADPSTEFGEAIHDNSSHNIQIIDLSGNNLTNSTIVPIATSLRSFFHQISVLSFANCNLSSRSICALIHAFRANWGMSLGIKELDLSKNKFDDVASTDLSEWFNLMKSHSKLKRLSLSDTNINIQAILTSIKHFINLEFLDLSYVNMSRMSSATFEDFIPTSNKLKIINIASTRLSANSIIVLLRYLFSKSLTELNVNISGNDIGSKKGILLADVIRIGKNLKVLDISNNNLGKATEVIVSSIQDNVSTLILDQNFASLSSKNFLRLSESLAGIINSKPNLAKLSLRGSSKGRINFSLMDTFFESLGRNETLVELDVSDNYMKDENFFKLCLSLRGNVGLRTLICSGNKITETGFQCLLSSLNHNETLTNFVYSYKDIKDIQHNIIQDILRKVHRNGDIEIIEDPFQFYINWDIPTKPSPPLCEIPSYLAERETLSPDMLFSAPNDAPPEPPTISGKIDVETNDNVTNTQSLSMKTKKKTKKKLVDETEPLPSTTNVPPPPPTSVPPPPLTSVPPPPPTSVPPPPPNTVPPPPVKSKSPDESSLKSFVPPPPPNSVPPPPVKVSKSSSNDESKHPMPSSSEDRSSLLSSIEAFKKNKLKKVVTNDRSAPIL